LRYAIGWSGYDKALIDLGLLLVAIKRVQIIGVEVVLVCEVSDDAARRSCAI
jgi:hypothetical protein